MAFAYPDQSWHRFISPDPSATNHAIAVQRVCRVRVARAGDCIANVPKDLVFDARTSPWTTTNTDECRGMSLITSHISTSTDASGVVQHGSLIQEHYATECSSCHIRATTNRTTPVILEAPTCCYNCGEVNTFGAYTPITEDVALRLPHALLAMGGQQLKRWLCYAVKESNIVFSPPSTLTFIPRDSELKIWRGFSSSGTIDMTGVTLTAAQFGILDPVRGTRARWLEIPEAVPLQWEFCGSFIPALPRVYERFMRAASAGGPPPDRKFKDDDVCKVQCMLEGYDFDGEGVQLHAKMIILHLLDRQGPDYTFKDLCSVCCEERALCALLRAMLHAYEDVDDDAATLLQKLDQRCTIVTDAS
jgi:hypothetical protein